MASDRFDWVGEHFALAKDIALYYVDVLERIVRGEAVSRVELVQNYVMEKHGIHLPRGVAEGLFYAGSGEITPGPIFRMGLETRVGYWKSLLLEEAITELRRARERIIPLRSLPDSTRAPPLEVTFKVTKTSDVLEAARIYTRRQLREIFSITDSRINNGVFSPDRHKSIWLFVTRHKTADRTQYHDQLIGDVLEWDGQMEGRTDDDIIDHAKNGNELLLFYRETRTQFDGAGFVYEGPFEYVSHTGRKPTHFILRRVQSLEEEVGVDIDDLSEEPEFVEGGKRTRLVSYHERDKRLAAAAIRHHGTKCMVCGFDFEAFYGPIGHNCIEAHHLELVSTYDRRREVDPVSDMVVLCSNCHRMIHRRRNHPISVEDLRAHIRRSRNV